MDNKYLFLKFCIMFQHFIYTIGNKRKEFFLMEHISKKCLIKQYKITLKIG